MPMTDNSNTDRLSLIEQAMLRQAANRADDTKVVDIAETRDQALAHRQAELQAVLGEAASAPPLTHYPPSAPITYAAPAVAAPELHHTPNFTPRAVLAIAFISALCGAAGSQFLLRSTPYGAAAGTLVVPALPKAKPASVESRIQPVATLATVDNSATPAIAATAAPVTPAAAAPAAAPLPAGLDEAPVRALVEGWRAAWAKRDVDAYLGFYSATFVPADGKSRVQWAAARRKNISSRSAIEVGVRDVKIETKGADQVEVRFLQDYASGALREQGRSKILLLQRVSGEWRIVGERQG